MVLYRSACQMTRYELAYLAGLFDGEGSISIAINTYCKGVPYYVLQVNISSCDEHIIKWVRAKVGFGIVFSAPPGYFGLSKRQMWRYQVKSQEAASFLRLLLPHVRMKKRQIQIALNFQSRLICKRGEVTAQEVKARQSCRNQLRKLLVKGHR